MNSDIRLAISFRGHRKRKRLRLLLGPGSTDYLIDLWIAVAMSHPNGILYGMDETDIALDAGWEGEPHTLVQALLECGFLEKTAEGYALHDWADHQAYVIHAEKRKMQARKAASSRWQGAANTPEMPGACCLHADSNAPSLLSSSLPNSSLLNSSQKEEIESSLRSDSLSGPGGPDEEVKAASPRREKAEKAKALPQAKPLAFPADSPAYCLAVLMRDTLQANVPTLKEPDVQKWAHSFDVALRNDERMANPNFVAEVIKWACADSFWRANIQSPEALRRQFDKLTARMESQAQKARTGPETGDWLSPAQRRVLANQKAGEEAERLLFGNTTMPIEAVPHDAS